MNGRLAVRFTIPILLLVLWEVASQTGLLPASTSAAPSQVFTEAARLFSSEHLFRHTLLSLARLATALVVGSLAGVSIGVWLGVSRRAEYLLLDTIKIGATVPAVVWTPFLIVAFGIGELYQISLPAIVTTLLFSLHLFNGVRETPQPLLEVSRLLELPLAVLIRRVLIPGSMSHFFSALRLSAALGWIVIYIAESSIARVGFEGLGWFIANARSLGQIESQFAGVLVLACCGLGTDISISLWQSHSMRWSNHARLNPGDTAWTAHST